MEGFALLAAVAANAAEQRNLAKEKRVLRDTSDPFRLTEEQFVTYFRFNQDHVRYICENLRESLVRRRSHGLSVETQVLTALRFFAVGSYQGCVGQDMFVSLSQSSVCKAIHAVADAIMQTIGQTWVQFPTQQNEKMQLKQRFRDAHGLKGVIGCIDCTQVSIFKPASHEETYVNHKGYHSLNVEAIASNNLRFLGVNARFPGSVHDSFIWRNSPFRAELVQQWDLGDHSSWLLGDSGYPLEPWLMTPVLNAPAGSAAERYTTAHSKTRSCVERAFGVLKNTFRCLMKDRTLHCSPLHASAIVYACVVLHNMRLHTNLLEVGMNEDAPVEELAAVEGDVLGERHGVAIRIRNALVRNFDI